MAPPENKLLVGGGPLQCRACPVAARGDRPGAGETAVFSWGLLPADSFYEWRATPADKQPYRILLKSEELFSCAGLWDEWADRETVEVVDTFTIITTKTNALMRPIHDRMPVLLHPEEEEGWLSGEKASEHLLSLLRPYQSEELRL